MRVLREVHIGNVYMSVGTKQVKCCLYEMLVGMNIVELYDSGVPKDC